MTFPAYRIAVIVMLLSIGLIGGCSRPPAESSNTEAQKLPFDREPRSTGISPSQSLIPSGTKLPEGTPIPIRLQTALSSASSHAGDSFSATVDEPVVIDGQTVITSGTPATGRVLEAKAAASSRGGSLGSSGGGSPGAPLEPGYLRLVLVSLKVDGKPVMIETSSIFVRGGSREERKPAIGAASGASQKDNNKDKNRDVVFGVDRRLNFRLAQTVDLQQSLH